MRLHLPKADPEKELLNRRGTRDRKPRGLGPRTILLVALKVTMDKLFFLP